MLHPTQSPLYRSLPFSRFPPSLSPPPLAACKLEQFNALVRLSPKFRRILDYFGPRSAQWHLWAAALLLLLQFRYAIAIAIDKYSCKSRSPLPAISLSSLPLPKISMKMYALFELQLELQLRSPRIETYLLIGTSACHMSTVREGGDRGQIRGRETGARLGDSCSHYSSHRQLPRATDFGLK